MPHNRNLLGCQRFHAQLLPSGWDCAPLSERIEFEYGFGLTEEIRRPGPYKVFGSNGVVGLHDEARVAGPGIIVGRKGTVGATTFTDSPFWPIDTVYYVTKKKQDDWRYLCVLLKFLDLGRLNAATGVPAYRVAMRWRSVAHSLRSKNSVRLSLFWMQQTQPSNARTKPSDRCGSFGRPYYRICFVAELGTKNSRTANLA